MLRKLKYVGVISSVFCVGSLMAGPQPGSGGAHPGGGSSSSGKSAPTHQPSGKVVEGVMRGESGGPVDPAGGNGSAMGSGSLIREERQAPGGGKITTFKSPSGGSAELQTSAEGGLVSLEITDADGVSTKLEATGTPGYFALTGPDGGTMGTLQFGADGQVAQYNGSLAGQAAATYNVEIDGSTTTFTSAANPSNVVTVTANADGSLVVKRADGNVATVPANGAIKPDELADKLSGDHALKVMEIATVTLMVERAVEGE